MSGTEPRANDDAARSAFDDCFARNHTELCRLAFLLCGDQRAAEEIVADAFAEARRRWDVGVQPDAQLSVVRRHAVHIATNRVPALPDARSADSAADVREALARVSATRRACVVLDTYCELPEFETARTLGLSEVSVSAEASRGISDIAAMLRADASADWLRGELTIAAFAYNPDSTRLSALVAERMTLAEQAAGGAATDADPDNERTAVQPRMTGRLGRRPGYPDRPARPNRLGRRGQACIALGALAAVAILVVELTSSGFDTGNDGQSVLPASESSMDLSAGSPQVTAGGSPTPTVTASASPTPSATPSASPSPSPSHSATPSASPSQTASSPAPQVVNASPSVNAGTTSTWTQLDLDVTIQQTLSSLTITIDVAHCRNLTPAAAWDTGSGGEFTESTQTQSNGSITYTFSLVSGTEANPGTLTFSAQFSHANSGWSATADSYSISGETTSSAPVSVSGTY